MTVVETCVVILTVIISCERIAATIAAVKQALLVSRVKKEVMDLKESVGLGATIGAGLGGVIGGLAKRYLTKTPEELAALNKQLKEKRETDARTDLGTNKDGKDNAGRGVGEGVRQSQEAGGGADGADARRPA